MHNAWPYRVSSSALSAAASLRMRLGGARVCHAGHHAHGLRCESPDTKLNRGWKEPRSSSTTRITSRAVGSQRRPPPPPHGCLCRRSAIAARAMHRLPEGLEEELTWFGGVSVVRVLIRHRSSLRSHGTGRHLANLSGRAVAARQGGASSRLEPKRHCSRFGCSKVASMLRTVARTTSTARRPSPFSAPDSGADLPLLAARPFGSFGQAPSRSTGQEHLILPASDLCPTCLPTRRGTVVIGIGAAGCLRGLKFTNLCNQC